MGPGFSGGVSERFLTSADVRRRRREESGEGRGGEVRKGRRERGEAEYRLIW
jgi:hypothetical protein